MKILYALCTWGLGHATRSLSVIRALLNEGHEIGIMSSGRTLELLRKELKDSVIYHDVPDYPSPYASTKLGFYLRFARTLPRILKGIKREHEETGKIISKHGYDRIISDNRYGVYASIPSYLITHQLRFIAPRRMRPIEKMGERFVAKQSENFTKIIVPDDEKGALSGELSHGISRIPEKKIAYVGPLSDFKRKDVNEDISLLISISGPEPQRSIFEERVMRNLEKMPEITVITLGKTEEYEEYRKGNALIYTYLPKEKREEILNRSKLILSRSGYSTIMDLAVLGKKAVFVPTPGQTEQEYLSEYHMKKGTYYSMEQKEFSIDRAMKESRKYKGIRMDGEKSVENVLREVL